MMGYLLQISQANNMIEKFIIGKKVRGSMFFGIFMLNKVCKVNIWTLDTSFFDISTTSVSSRPFNQCIESIQTLLWT